MFANTLDADSKMMQHYKKTTIKPKTYSKNIGTKIFIEIYVFIDLLNTYS